ncbi:MAG: matrixin family metalloprotease, partial [Methanotrichaceae archaeon]|nr:matrixin family metalloprotease [Methanotrichaceae archaeon]
SSWLAMNRLIYSYQGELKDADVQYNKKYSWTTGTAYGAINIQTVATHELGHNVGLLDLYNDLAFRWDKEQIMNSYWRAQTWLGSGDKAGIKAQYTKTQYPLKYI